MKLGPLPTLDAAMDKVRRVGLLVGGETAAKFARELREIAADLAAGKSRGPKEAPWHLEAARLALAATIAERGYERRAALVGAKSLIDKLPELEARAAGDADALAEVAALRREVEAAVGDEVEQVQMSKAGALVLETPDGTPIEGKAMTDMSRDQERDLGRFIRRIGGYVQSGGRAGDVLDYDAPHFERAMTLIRGEAEPESDDEARELERWKAKHD